MSEEHKKLWYSPVPLALAFEPINLCNARCFCCPYTEFADDKSFIKHININLKAPAILIRDFAKRYKGKDGNIINADIAP